MTNANPTEQPDEGVQNPDAVARAQAAPTELDGHTAPDSATVTEGGPSAVEPDDGADTDTAQPA